MKFTISREDLFKALRAVAGVVERKTSQNHALSCLLLTASDNHLEMIAIGKDLEITTKVKIIKPINNGSVLISCQKLNDIVRVLPEHAEILIDNSSEEKVLLKSGKSKFMLTALPVENFPKTSTFLANKELIIPRIGFIRLLEHTAFAMAEQDVRYYLNGALLEINKNFLRAVASDGHRLALQDLALETPLELIKPISIIVPRKSILELIRAFVVSNVEQVTLSFSSSSLRVSCDDLIVTSSLLSGRYPDYTMAVPKKGNTVVYCSREVLKTAISRASSLLHDKLKGVRLKLSTALMQIMAYNTEKDEVEEHLDIDFNGPEIELGFNSKYLIDFLTASYAETVQMSFAEASGSVILEDANTENNGLCVIMSMRV